MAKEEVVWTCNKCGEQNATKKGHEGVERVANWSMTQRTGRLALATLGLFPLVAECKYNWNCSKCGYLLGVH